MKRLALGAAFGLAACGAPAVTTPPVSMTFSDPAAASAVDTFDLVTIRTASGQFTSRTVVSGATCEVFGTGYSATFTSPAILRMPLYRGKTSDARVVCMATVDGVAKSDAVTLEATNLSAPENEGVTVSVGSSGTSVGAVFSIRDRARDRFDYPRSKTLILR